MVKRMDCEIRLSFDTGKMARKAAQKIHYNHRTIVPPRRTARNPKTELGIALRGKRRGGGGGDVCWALKSFTAAAGSLPVQGDGRLAVRLVRNKRQLAGP